VQGREQLVARLAALEPELACKALEGLVGAPLWLPATEGELECAAAPVVEAAQGVTEVGQSDGDHGGARLPKAASLFAPG
jgi:hypothetical protein